MGGVFGARHGALLGLGRRRAHIGKLKMSELQHAYGFGFRFNTYKTVSYRIDLGFGGEGVQAFFKFSKAF